MRPYLADRTGRNNSYRLFSISVIFCSSEAKREGDGESSMVILVGLCVLYGFPLGERMVLRGRRPRSWFSMVKLINYNLRAILESRLLLLLPTLPRRSGMGVFSRSLGGSMSIAGFLKGLCVILFPVIIVESRKEAVCRGCDCRSCQNLVWKRRWFACPLLLMIILD